MANVPDLRGYGQTDKPSSGYDKRTVAKDVRALMEEVGIARSALIGHDRGVRVATRLAKDHPDAITRLGVLDIIRTRAIFERMDATMARGRWLVIFNQVPYLPEALIAGREEIWREMAPDLRAVAIPRCGHLPHEERPDDVNEALLSFLGGEI